MISENGQTASDNECQKKEINPVTQAQPPGEPFRVRCGIRRHRKGWICWQSIQQVFEPGNTYCCQKQNEQRNKYIRLHTHIKPPVLWEVYFPLRFTEVCKHFNKYLISPNEKSPKTVSIHQS